MENLIEELKKVEKDGKILSANVFYEIASAREELKKRAWCHECDEMVHNCTNAKEHLKSKEWWIRFEVIDEVLGEK